MGQGWGVAAPRLNVAILSPSPGHPAGAPAGGCRGRSGHRCHCPWHHHLLLHEEAAEAVITQPPGEGAEPPAVPPAPRLEKGPAHSSGDPVGGGVRAGGPRLTPCALSSSRRFCLPAQLQAHRQSLEYPPPLSDLPVIYLTSPDPELGGMAPIPPPPFLTPPSGLLPVSSEPAGRGAVPV